MRLIPIFLLATSVIASWFGNDKNEYASWGDSELIQWLEHHDITVPKGFSTKELQDLVKANWAKSQEWTTEQYENAQKVFADTKAGAYRDWDESKLRKFLVDQGVVNPSGPKESLMNLASQQYASYTSYASVKASTAIYGDKSYQASKSASSAASAASEAVSSVSASASSLAAAATTAIGRKFDETKDAIYSDWSDSELRGYLEEKGIIAPPKSTRQELLGLMQGAYDKTWESWTDSYMHDWLVDHGVIRSEAQKKRDEYLNLMESYYYDLNSKVWDTWSESELRRWLLDHNIIKTDAQLKREKLLKLVKDNYQSALDTVYAGWTDSQIREWLIDNGYIRTETQAKRDELIRLFNEKYKDATAASAAYLTWPDARLRAYLRNHDMDRAEALLPTSRPGLLQEVRIRWVQTSTGVEDMYWKLRDLVNSGVEFAEDKIGEALAILTGAASNVSKKTSKTKADSMKEYDQKFASASKVYSSLTAEAALVSKTAAATVVREFNVKVASASSVMSSISAEAAKASKQAKAEL